MYLSSSTTLQQRFSFALIVVIFVGPLVQQHDYGQVQAHQQEDGVTECFSIDTPTFPLNTIQVISVTNLTAPYTIKAASLSFVNVPVPYGINQWTVMFGYSMLNSFYSIVGTAFETEVHYYDVVFDVPADGVAEIMFITLQSTGMNMTGTICTTQLSSDDLDIDQAFTIEPSHDQASSASQRSSRPVPTFLSILTCDNQFVSYNVSTGKVIHHNYINNDTFNTCNNLTSMFINQQDEACFLTTLGDLYGYDPSAFGNVAYLPALGYFFMLENNPIIYQYDYKRNMTNTFWLPSFATEFIMGQGLTDDGCLFGMAQFRSNMSMNRIMKFSPSERTVEFFDIPVSYLNGFQDGVWAMFTYNNTPYFGAARNNDYAYSILKADLEQLTITEVYVSSLLAFPDLDSCPPFTYDVNGYVIMLGYGAGLYYERVDLETLESFNTTLPFSLNNDVIAFVASH
ncbi:hypothetical protein SAMD00019534_066880 [Acytostelium subglobosum LB1]|uniref:hypothetical protein n=1 Tax=Acytostelium subglobosum LB1 TaxID=1410327 RepID=UPI000644A990|nr:hypothetical protein SAMD00019534_066880 [Acytostelium subglobosum LB1]GAM23513.1 hypothetical protein SAMD00019534_066880 [Acytostelium subglobosum LB1]|eukprot:XP_012753254.1 hypothetical protein SAMD00019534_066880 [Acytostelium subglobosum LB1]